MKQRLFILIFSALLFLETIAAAAASEHPKKPFSVLMPLLEPIVPDAMLLGHGPVDVYVFVDPECPHSREFVTFIAESAKMQSRYRYHFYLLELPRFHSQEIINAIYAAPSPLEAMIAHMTKQTRMTPVESQGAAAGKIARIKAAADTIDVYKRPYLILNKPPKTARKK